MTIFERLESEVRGYCRNFPAVFTQAQGAVLRDQEGNEYIDFFAGAGALNYGHNHPRLKEKLIAYITSDGVTHSLDMMTEAKAAFLRRFEQSILKPRNLKMKAMFPGPTGTNAVEAALKLARKVTGRTEVVSFTNGFHGMTLGSLSVTGNSHKRGGAGLPLGNTTSLPFDGYMGGDVNTLELIESYLSDGSSGLDKPAAFILETVQAEGGVIPASNEWLAGLQGIAREHDILMIIDDIQVGCGRTGTYFSFEQAGLDPDIVCLSKSLSGYGTPMSLVLMKPEHDQFSPGEHNGTFRGHNLAFVTATEALGFWEEPTFTGEILKKAHKMQRALQEIVSEHEGSGLEWRGRGMIQGIAFNDEKVASEVSRKAFEKGLIIETSGPNDEVLKLLPPLMIEEVVLGEGLEVIAACVDEVFQPHSGNGGTGRKVMVQV